MRFIKLNVFVSQTMELLEIASESITQARKDFDQLSKLDVNTARAVLCEDAFRTVPKTDFPFNP